MNWGQEARGLWLCSCTCRQERVTGAQPSQPAMLLTPLSSPAADTPSQEPHCPISSLQLLLQLRAGRLAQCSGCPVASPRPQLGKVSAFISPCGQSPCCPVT